MPSPLTSALASYEYLCTRPLTRLYNYIAPRWASLLEMRRIRFTQPIYFNDPFELAPCIEAAMDASYENRLIREVLEGIAANPSAGAEGYRAALADHERVTGIPFSTLFSYEQQIVELVPVIPDLMRAILEPASTEIGRTYYCTFCTRRAGCSGRRSAH